jgi:general secretion pathway protein D
MNKYLQVKKRALALLCGGAIAFAYFAAPSALTADATAEKIRVMADALRARDAGDLDTAQSKAEELVRMAPDNENAQRLLAAINRDIERREGGQAAVFGQAAEVDVERAATPAATADSAQPTLVSAAQNQSQQIAAAKQAARESRQMADLGAFSEAFSTISEARGGLEWNLATARAFEQLDAAEAYVVLVNAQQLAAAGEGAAAEALLRDFRERGGDQSTSNRVTRAIHAELRDPANQDVAELSPEFVENQRIIAELIGRGRALFLNGDYEGAIRTFQEVEARDPNNAEAKLFQTRLASIITGIHTANRFKTREQMLSEVEQAWDRPKVFDVDTTIDVRDTVTSPILRKLAEIRIPRVNFQGMELTRVIETLSELSVDFDPEGQGVNIIPLFDPATNNPRVSINVRNLSLDEILQFITQQVNFVYDVGRNAVTVTATDARGGRSDLVTEFFPITRATVIRLTGLREGGGGGGGGSRDPFAAPQASAAPSGGDEADNLRRFFSSAGVNFDIPGASLAFDGEQIIVTQTTRNLERMRIILRNYDETKQVEIEAKFLEVVQGDLEELGFDWLVSSRNGATVFQAGGRNAASAFGIDQAGSQIAVTQAGTPRTQLFNNTGNLIADIDPTPPSSLSVPFFPPQIPGLLDLGEGAVDVFTGSPGWNVNGYNVDFAIRALSRRTGSDLMSAPKVTVLSGKPATITVAQELRYPESYGDIDSQVSQSSGTGGGGGAAGVTITAGTPRDFVTRNIGVEMSVTPNVETNDTISLILEPRVTEFEGFVEYGGPSVAIASGTTVTVPAGFFQPIFSTREIRTEVTVFDGATIVMGGLTRDEVRSYSDKVPVLGDIPLLGRLFRSEGETRQKRNLLIFVTANLVSPGGSPARQRYRTVEPNSLFQNPTIMTPSGSANRRISADNAE